MPVYPYNKNVINLYQYQARKYTQASTEALYIMNHTLNDTWIRIINPLLLFIVSALAQQAILPPLTEDKLWLALRLLFFITVTFEAGRVVSVIARRKYPATSQLLQRVAMAYGLTVMSTFALITMSTIVNRIFIDKSAGFGDESFINLIQSVWMGILIVAPYEVLYSYYRSVQAEREKDALVKENIQRQLTSLQAQVNPHFLFNSLNALSELTRKDPEKAEQFVLELSTVYRYLLQSNTTPLTTLTKELQFMQSYLSLLQLRYGSGLQSTIRADDAYKNYRLPPLTLQLLAENAVKHNEINSDTPLQVTISTSNNGWLTVANSVHAKSRQAPSGGFGLSGLQTRYRLLNQPDIRIDATPSSFSVSIPLIPPGA